MILSTVLTFSVITPGANTVHRLGTLLSGALLKLVSIWASISTVGRCNRDIVSSATLVAVCFLVVEASVILVPGTNTVHRLGTLLNGALLKLISIWASISVVSRCD